MRFELFIGRERYGEFATRRLAMADAELFAAKRGERLDWVHGRNGVSTAEPSPDHGDARFTVRRVRGARWSRNRE